MSSPRYATPLRLSIKASPRLQVIFILFLLLCFIALLLSHIPIWLKLLAVVVLVAAGLKTWRSRPELGGESSELVLRPNGNWLFQRAGREETLQLLGESVVNPAIIILLFAGDGGRQSFVLWRWEVDGDVWRRLGVYLRLYGTEEMSG